MTIGAPETGQWTGTGWISMDPANGAAGYLISGGHNGGATVEEWPPEFIDLSEEDRDIRDVTIEIVTPLAEEAERRRDELVLPDVDQPVRPLPRRLRRVRQRATTVDVWVTPGKLREFGEHV